ncbi:hypothetical protein [Rhodococcus sp. NPDC060176]|uniref:hypothetical protein n=1 Tax=Rhodococcus sp. NPDC060176 TaxID=3347062 RepID=UPI0036467025
MSRTYRHNDKEKRKTDYRKGGRPRKDRNISVRGIHRDTPDLQRLSRAVIALALAEAEREAANDDSRAKELRDD